MNSEFSSASALLLAPKKSHRSVLTLTSLQNELKHFFLDTKASPLGIKKILLCLAKRGESAEEVGAVIRLIQSLEPRLQTGLSGIIDLCGTGGDGLKTFNISTVSAFIIAGAGGKVAKHGNRAVSSRCGSSDLIEALGINLAAPRSKMLEALKTAGIAYLHAPHYHPIFAKVQPLRKELGVRTLFNLLGPFLNPFFPERQMIGVSKGAQVDFFIRILKLKKMARAAVYHSLDGMDELSTAAATRIAEIRKGKLFHWTVQPAALGFRKAHIRDYAGGNTAANKQIALDLLKGRIRGPKRDIVELNAAMGLYLTEKAPDLKSGLELARKSLNEGLALKALKTLQRISHS